MSRLSDLGSAVYRRSVLQTGNVPRCGLRLCDNVAFQGVGFSLNQAGGKTPSSLPAVVSKTKPMPAYPILSLAFLGNQSKNALLLAPSNWLNKLDPNAAEPACHSPTEENAWGSIEPSSRIPRDRCLP